MKRLLMTSLLAAAVSMAAAQASEPPAPVADDAAAQTQMQTPEEAKKAAADQPFCLRHTGTRIVSRANTQKQRACSGAIGRAYTREDLDRTGRIDIADALRALDPSIH